jgi:hypothetical protein
MRSIDSSPLSLLLFSIVGLVLGSALALGLFYMNLISRFPVVLALMGWMGGASGLAIGFLLVRRRPPSLRQATPKLRVVLVLVLLLVTVYFVQRGISTHSSSAVYDGLVSFSLGLGFVLSDVSRRLQVISLGIAALLSVIAFLSLGRFEWLISAALSVAGAYGVYTRVFGNRSNNGSGKRWCRSIGGKVIGISRRRASS